MSDRRKMTGLFPSHVSPKVRSKGITKGLVKYLKYKRIGMVIPNDASVIFFRSDYKDTLSNIAFYLGCRTMKGELCLPKPFGKL